MARPGYNDDNSLNTSVYSPPSRNTGNNSGGRDQGNRFYSPSSVSNNPARVNLNKNSGDTSNKGFSFSTKDVRSSPQQREDFRIRTGQQTTDPVHGITSIRSNTPGLSPAERIARTKAYITGNNKFIDSPIFHPGNISRDDLDEIASAGEGLIDYENSTGKLSKDWKDWFDSQVGFTDITGDSFDETSKGWYDDDDLNLDVSSGVMGGGYDYGYDYGGDSGNAAAYAMMNRGPKQLGAGESVPGQAELLDYMINVNSNNPFTQLAMPQMAAGGIMGLMR